MTDYVEGVRFVNAQFAPQGASGAPWDNEWVTSNNTLMKVEGSLQVPTPFKWYFRGDETDPNNTFSPYPYNQNIVLPDDNESGPAIDCEAALLTNDDFDRDLVFGPVVGDTAEYDAYPDELRYLAREALFSRLSADTSLLTVGSNADSSFHAFYNEMLAANTGRFDSVRLAITGDNLVAAGTINEAIADDNEMETNRKFINSLIINKLAAGDTLDGADTTALEAIFEQHWITAGMSVYNAAAMLGKEYYAPEISSRLVQAVTEMKTETKKETPVKAVPRVYPNPANDRLFITGMTEGLNVLEIYDSYARQVIKKQTHELNHSIDLSGIVNGIYYIRIANDENELFFQRFVVLKK